MPDMPAMHISLDIGPDQFVEWYRGRVRSVVVKSLEGPVVEFPAKVLQRFVSPTGIQGTFLLSFDSQNRFLSIERVEPASGLDLFG
jgi:hypothetical protein